MGTPAGNNPEPSRCRAEVGRSRPHASQVIHCDSGVALAYSCCHGVITHPDNPDKCRALMWSAPGMPKHLELWHFHRRPSASSQILEGSGWMGPWTVMILISKSEFEFDFRHRNFYRLRSREIMHLVVSVFCPSVCLFIRILSRFLRGRTMDSTKYIISRTVWSIIMWFPRYHFQGNPFMVACGGGSDSIPVKHPTVITMLTHHASYS